MDEIAQFVAERNAALLSLDEEKIKAYLRKWSGVEPPSDPLVFWGSVHKAITGCTDLPRDFRHASKCWLDQHGWKSFDEGDL